ncbi:MAG: hypothetical protein ACXVW6_07275 [Nocardioidaceae bacterium]
MPAGLDQPASAVRPVEGRRPDRGSRARTWVLVACLVIALEGEPFTAGRRLLPWLMTAAAMILVVVFTWPGNRGLSRPRRTRSEVTLTGILVGSALVLGGARLAVVALDRGWPVQVVASLWGAYLIAGSAGVLSARRWALPAFLSVQVVLVAAAVLVVDIPIDVEVYLREGVHALLHGADPYAIRYTNPYTPLESRSFYGPQVLVDGAVDYGFPYLPTSLLAVVPGYLMGDVRLAHLAMLALVTVLLLCHARDRVDRALVALVLLSPVSVALVLSSWTEPTLLVGLVLMVVGAQAGRRVVAGSGAALLFSSKQYVVVLLPLLWLFERVTSRRTVLWGLAGATLVVLPFLVMNPREMVRSVVEFHLLQPFRPTSDSLLVAAVRSFGWPPPWTYGVLPLALGGVTSGLLAWRLPRTPSAFALGAGASLMVTMLASKQAFPNYYWFVEMAFVTALVLGSHGEESQR